MPETPQTQTEQPPQKICPFQKARYCTPECALFIVIEKPVVNTVRGVAYPDAEVTQLYAGCGLVIEKPWVTVKREVAPETPETPEEAEKAHEKVGEAKT